MNEVAQVLIDDGWDYSYVCMYPGGFNEQARFSVTVTLNGSQHTFDYYMGYGLRRWTKTTLLKTQDPMVKYAKPGKQIDFGIFNLRLNEHQVKFFNQYTEPIPPALDEIVYALWSDASSVFGGQTFEDFCDGFGYDTDSMRAKEIYDGCRDQYFALVRLGANMDRLSMIFEEY